MLPMHTDRHSSEISRDVLATALTDAVGTAVVVSSARGVEYVNKAFTQLIGLQPDTLGGATVETFVSIACRGAIAGQLQELASGTIASNTREIVLASTDGTEVRAEHTAHIIDVDAGRFVVSTFVPVSDASCIRRALHESEARYRELFEDDACGRFEASLAWEITRCNGTLARMLGVHEPSQLLGRSLLECSPDAPIFQKLLATVRVQRRAGPSELQLQGVGGECLEASCSITGVFDTSGALVAMRGAVTDIGAAKREQLRLLGEERMELLARLAGGLAHDFNNLLTIIRGHGERLREALPTGGAVWESASAIEQASTAAAALTRQLLAFGRRQVLDLRPLSLAHLLADAEPALAGVLGDRIRLRVVAGPALPDIRVDARQIQDVLVNLARNAREAMRDGGTLTIAIDTMDIGRRAPADKQWLRPGRYVRLIVADTGHGMDPVTRSHAFQPFFTTKEIGTGTGLGLATVYGIMKQSNGFVWVESSVGQGAVFTLLFPAIDSPGAALPGTGIASEGSETILVAMDDERLRTHVGETLARRGYAVLLAGSGREAVDLFASSATRIHLLVGDATAEAAAGVPLAARLKNIDPMLQSLTVLEPATEEMRRRSVLPTAPAIRKPFTLHAVAAQIRAILDSGEGRG
jgi:two-component system, cell cycle sensor histidine kinase and response regulator CckA